jgi:hypothetical protein
MNERYALGAVLFQPLIAFDATVGTVASLAFFPDQLDAVDAAIALIEKFEVIHHSAGNARAAGCERSGTEN